MQLSQKGAPEIKKSSALTVKISFSGDFNPTCEDITIGDISVLIDYLFISGPGAIQLPGCL